MLQGTQARLGEYDLTSGCCLATATISSPPEKLAYSRDGRLIIALLEDRSLVAFLDQLSKSQTLLPGNSKHAKNPARFHLAVSAVCKSAHLCYFVLSTASVEAQLWRTALLQVKYGGSAQVRN